MQNLQHKNPPLPLSLRAAHRRRGRREDRKERGEREGERGGRGGWIDGGRREGAEEKGILLAARCGSEFTELGEQGEDNSVPASSSRRRSGRMRKRKRRRGRRRRSEQQAG
eukprot:3098790-Rhodomonas_salina.1